MQAYAYTQFPFIIQYYSQHPRTIMGNQTCQCDPTTWQPQLRSHSPAPAHSTELSSLKQLPSHSPLKQPPSQPPSQPPTLPPMQPPTQPPSQPPKTNQQSTYGLSEQEKSLLPLQSNIRPQGSEVGYEQGLQQGEGSVYDEEGVNLEVQSNLGGSVARVPYSIIRLIISKPVFEILQKVDKQFYCTLQTAATDDKIDENWRLQPQGYYTNRILDGTMVIVNESILYRGWTRDGSLLPHGTGLLITPRGHYQGNFQQGKAHGKGTFTSTSNSLYSGQWKQGQLFLGKITGDTYTYQGTLLNNIPSGTGTLTVYKQKISTILKPRLRFKYEGGFLEGKFEGQGRHETPDRVYVGEFKQGKKQGQGVVTVVASGVRLEGLWEGDVFRGKAQTR